MKTEKLAAAALLLGLTACDRAADDLLPQVNEAAPQVVEIGELPVLPASATSEMSATYCDSESENPNCYYGQVRATDGVTVGGATFSFKGTGSNVCVVVDPESLTWNQYIGAGNSSLTWGYPDNNADDGDLDLFGGLTSYYTGSPGVEIGDFTGFYTDSLGRQIEIDYVECYNESPYTGGEAHAGRGAPEYCTINTAGRAGIDYTVVLETFSVPRDDGLLAFSAAVFEGRCNSLTDYVGLAGVTECTMTGESRDEAGDLIDCSRQREFAYCLNTNSPNKRYLTAFCCQNPEACGEDPPDDICADVAENIDELCSEYPNLCDCSG